MKILHIARLITVSLALTRTASGQGFVNLDFESANVSGYPQGSSLVPVSSALPGWSAYYIVSGAETNMLSQMGYDYIPTSGVANLSVMDSNAGQFQPSQGQFSACLFGAVSGPAYNASLEISQTALVPSGTRSLLIDVSDLYGFEVTLDGQVIVLTPLQRFSNYTLYGGDITAFAGQISTLSLISPPTGSPNVVEFDSVIFSPSSIPEPSTLSVASIVILFCWRRRKWPNTSLEPTPTRH